MKKLFVFIFILLLVSTSLPVGAEIIDNISLSNGELNISGTIPDYVEDNITISILAENAYWTTAAAELSGNPLAKSLEDYVVEDDIYDYLAWFGQLSAEPGESYTLTIPGYAGPDEPEIRFRLGDEDYYYYSPGELIVLNAASSADELQSAYAASSYLWSSISEIYEMLDSNELKESFWQACLDCRNGLEGRKFLTFADAIKAAEDSYFLAKFTLCDERGELEELYDEFFESGKITNSYDIYTSRGEFARNDNMTYMSDAQKNALAEYIIENKEKYNDACSFIDEFNKQIVLYAVSLSHSKELVADILGGSSLLADELSDYSELTRAKKLKVAVLINEQAPYAGIDALIRAVSDFCDKTEKENSVNGGSGGGSGSSGGGSNGEKAVSVNGTGYSPENSSNAKVCPFTDIDSASWAKDAICELYFSGIISGRSETVFDPSGKVSRAEFIKMLVLAFGGADTDAVCEFSDSKPGDWHYRYVSTAVNRGLIKGMGEGKFGSNDTISRQDMAVIIARALKGNSDNAESGFADDANISDYAKGAVSFVRTESIMSGMGDNCFEPLSSVTRAQAAKVIYEILRRGAV